jgi:histidinol-phosphate aminotransferase
VVKLIHEYPQLFVARTFSKVAGLASLRLGAVIAHRDSLTMLRRATAPFPVNLAALVAAVAAVNDRKTMSGFLRNIAQTREWFQRQLNALGIKTYPSSCNFLLINFGSAGPALFERLTRDGVLLRDRAKDIGPGFARISIGTQVEMERLMKKIKRYWKK